MQNEFSKLEKDKGTIAYEKIYEETSEYDDTTKNSVIMHFKYLFIQ